MGREQTSIRSTAKSIDESAKPQPHEHDEQDSNVVHHCKDCKSPDSRLMRFLRIGFIIFSTALTIYICELSSERYFNVWVQTSIDSTDLHISEIPFPAVTVCPMRIATLTDHETAQISDYNVQAKLAQYAQLTRMAQHIFDNSPEADNLMPLDFDQNYDLERILLDDLFGFVDYTCDDLFDRCTWRHKNISCCTLFRRLTTVEGACYAFNTQFVKEADNSWPWSVARSGPASGLRVFINRNIHGDIIEKIFVGVHDSKEYLTPNTFHSTEERIIVPIEPLKFSADMDVTTLPVSMRQCRFQGENHFHYQKQSDCIIKCHLAHISRKCNCSYMYDIPMYVASSETDMISMVKKPNSNGETRRSCQVSDLQCFHENRHSFFTMGNIIVETESPAELTTYNCECYPDCNRVQYRTASYSEKVASTNSDTALVELEVYFQQETLFSYRSLRRFTLLDLLVAYGGIAGLCLGFSMVSIFDRLLECLGRCKGRSGKKK